MLSWGGQAVSPPGRALGAWLLLLSATAWSCAAPARGSPTPPGLTPPGLLTLDQLRGFIRPGGGVPRRISPSGGAARAPFKFAQKPRLPAASRTPRTDRKTARIRAPVESPGRASRATDVFLGRNFIWKTQVKVPPHQLFG